MTRAAAPRVGVVMAVHDGRDWIGEALGSIAAQTLPAREIEVVVVDDGSRDGSAEIAARTNPRATVLRQEHRGVSAARNLGIRATTAPYLLFLDADDRLAPDVTATALARFTERPELALVHTGWRYIDEAGVELPQRWGPPDGDALPQLLLGNAIVIHAALVRREVLEQIGGFDEALDSVEDWDLWIRIARLGRPWACVDGPLVDYRMRSGALHTRALRFLDNRVRVLDKVFADPTLPPSLAAMGPAAYQAAYFLSACELYQSGERAAGRVAFRKGVAIRPESLAEPDRLRSLCRWLLPQGHQCEAAVVARWRRLSTMLHAMLRDLFATPGLEREIAQRRWQAERAFWQTTARLVRKGTAAAVRRRLAYSM